MPLLPERSPGEAGMNPPATVALDTAIAAEMAAADLYSRLAQQAGSKESRQLFLSLSADEQRHRQTLERRYLTAVGRPHPSSPFVPFPLPDAAGVMLWPAALTLAINAEIQAHDRYVRLAAETTDAAGQAIFRDLAADEAGHRRLLEAEYAARLGQPFSDYELSTWVRE